MAKREKKDLWHDGGDGHRGKCCAKSWCPVMRMAIEDDAPRRGIGTAILFNFTSGKTTPIAVYRQTPQDSGVMLNVCPWCKADLAKLVNAQRKGAA